MPVRTGHIPAKQILNEKFGGAAFVSRLPMMDRYFALASTAYESGREKAAFKMGVYAAAECFLEGYPPFGFLQSYGLTTSESRLARALAAQVCVATGNSEKKQKILDQRSLSENEIIDLIIPHKFAYSFIKRRAREETHEPERKKAFGALLENGTVQEKTYCRNVERARYSNSLMDAVIMPPEREN